jgi:hypothetical protein
MITGIMFSSLAGIQNSLTQFDAAASRIASNTSQVAAPTTVTPSEPLSSPVVDNEPALEEDLVSLLLAKRFIQGQLGVIQTEDDLLAEAINLGRRRAE